MTLPASYSYIRAATAVTGQLLRVTEQERPFDLAILHAGIEHFPAKAPPLKQAEHRHPIYHVVLYLEGESRFLLRGQSHPCHPGTLVIASPGEPHTFPPQDGQATTYLEVTFEFVHADERLALPFHDVLARYTGVAVPARSYPAHLPAAHWQPLEACLRGLLNVLTAPHPHQSFLAGRQMVDLLSMLLQYRYLSTGAPTAVATTPFDTAKQLIEHRFRERVTLEELAESIGVSSGYFSRAFKRAFGVSPIRYQQGLRVNAAKILLATTDLPCKEIAMRLGYTDEFYFSRTFKQLSGMTPRAYRRSG
ncbi:MAG TPA: AraC family transcriptional regulator [Armatimonadota bacterium]|jgi:AraC-like DNA-binding protein